LKPFTSERSHLPWVTRQIVLFPSSLKRRLPCLATVIPTGLPQKHSHRRDEVGNEIFVLAARSHVIAVLEAQRRSAFAHDDQFGAVAIVRYCDLFIASPLFST
jgi:hypothetical protein